VRRRSWTRSAGSCQRTVPVALQELHTRTFDVQAITSLDIGYTLFGEDYKRGALLANLSAEHARAGNDCGLELADHLTNVLRLLPRMADADVREDFVRLLLVPALMAMLAEFEPDRVAKKEALYRRHHKTIIESIEGDGRTAYRHALEAVVEVLRQDFALDDEPVAVGISQFAGSVGTEMTIESCGTCVMNTRGAQ
jgi:nitrate reductase assembly molybdenum cofactor insertion protein NarJ